MQRQQSSKSLKFLLIQFSYISIPWHLSNCHYVPISEQYLLLFKAVLAYLLAQGLPIPSSKFKESSLFEEFVENIWQGFSQKNSIFFFFSQSMLMQMVLPLRFSFDLGFFGTLNALETGWPCFMGGCQVVHCGLLGCTHI